MSLLRRVARVLLLTGGIATGLTACGADVIEPPADLPPVLAIVAGDEQEAPAGLPVPVEPTVRVTDADGTPQPGVEVLWRVTEGGGAVDAHRMFTDSAGRASIRWTLGDELGQQLLYASTAGTAGVTFRARADLYFTTVEAGWRHTCGLDPRGLAWCWGDNQWGQLGDGTREASPQSRMVAGGRSFEKLFAGMLHSCALTSLGAAYCWGDNGSGQLGNGSTRSSAAPVLVVGGREFSHLSLGYDHTCGITTGADLYCWGNDTHGQLGVGGVSGEICSLGGLNAPCSRLPRRVTLPGVAIAVATGEGHTCAATGLQRTYCWGHNDWGQLGIGRFGGNEDEPALVLGDLLLVDVVAWGRSTCGLNEPGHPYCWGQNAGGKLGINSLLNLSRPAAVVSPGEPILEIGLGDSHACALAASRSVYCWGALPGNGSGAASLVPELVPGDRDYDHLSVGGDHGCGYAEGVWCWGSNRHGQLGVSPDSVPAASGPVLVRRAPPAGNGS